MANIIVIDDDLFVRDVVSKALQMHGHDVEAFEDGGPALELADFEKADLLITDLRMPTPGDQVIASLKERGVKIPIIVLSGYLDKEQTERLEKLGVEQMLQKPFKVLELVQVVNIWLE